ncbi:MAG: PrsW family glutamic-type intramembrane protease [Lachnospiraceae bacterium]|nr:PrsW family glutamic-type intramembrane protease [Lachnospiraceae bacterium]
MFVIGIIPPLLLLIYIYKKDKREKEPIRFLTGCFFCGVAIIPFAYVMEMLLTVIEDLFLSSGSVTYALVDGFIIAAFSEELLKYLALKLKTWKSRNYNCTFDGIVYAVYVSLGFAALENVCYIADGGLGTAIMRAFTSIPGHASNAVFMGYYYSLAKKAALNGDKASEKRNKFLAVFVPVITHGFYDSLLFFQEETVGEMFVLMALFVWSIYIVVLYIFTFTFVNKASKCDTYFDPEDEARETLILKKGSWICTCRNINTSNFCTQCGTKCPE